MLNHRMALTCAAFLVVGAAAPASAEEAWKTEGATLTGWPGWCSRIGIQSVGFTTLFPLEATPCDKPVPLLTIIQVEPPGKNAIDMDARFGQMLEQVASPAAKAFHLAGAIRQHGPCVQLAHEVETSPLPGLRAYEVHAIHQCQRYAIAADTRSLNIVVQSASGAVWTMSFDHPGADLTAEQDTLLRRTAAELAAAS